MTAYNLYIKYPEGFEPDNVLVIDKETGCHFYDNELRHTNECKCGDYE